MTLSSQIVFLDTSAIIALLNKKDQYHEKIHQFIKFQKSPSAFMLTNLILNEFLTFFSRYGDLNTALRFQNDLLNNPSYSVIWVDQTCHLNASSLIKKYADQNLSFCDAVSFAVMKENKIRTALAFDDDFRHAGFEMLPD